MSKKKRKVHSPDFKAKLKPVFKPRLMVDGIGDLLGLIIMPETATLFAPRRSATMPRLSMGGSLAHQQRQAQGPRQHQERQSLPSLGRHRGG